MFFLMQNNASFLFLCWSSLRKLFIFHRLSYTLKYKPVIFPFIFHIKSNCRIFTLKHFPIFYCWWVFYSNKVRFILKWFNIWNSYWVLFNCPIIYCSCRRILKTFIIFIFRFIVAFLCFVQSKESMYDPLRLNLSWHL